MKKNGRRINRSYRIGAIMLCLLLMASVLTSCGKEADRLSTELAGDAIQNSSGTAGAPNAGKNENYDAVTDGDSGESGQYQTKIIRTASISAETKSFDSALAEIEASVLALGGYIESSDVSGRNYETYEKGSCRASMRVRIPAEKLDEFLARTGSLVNVVSSSVMATDVSNQYYDIEARLSVLETEKQVLEKMLAQSNSVSEMISIEQRLYDVIYEIESNKTQLKLYDSKIAYSTVSISLWEVSDLTVVVSNPSFGARLKQATAESWQNFVSFCKELVIWLIYALPTLIVFCAVAVIVLVVALRATKRSKKMKKSEKPAEEEKAE